MRDSDYTVLNRAVSTYGKKSQLNVAIEEMSELTNELCKFQRGRSDRERIAEEVADVEIMLAQLRIIFGINKSVKNWRNKKIDRLKERLEKEHGKKES